MKNATRLTVSVFGALTGAAGLEHGIGEVLQGNVAPDEIVIQSWPGPGPFSILSGEPAMTIVPNLLVAGVLTIALSLIFLVWAVLFVQNKHGGPVLILLSLLMLLAGGGFAPPIMGVIIGAAATRINAPLGWQRVPLLAALWPWSLGAGVATWLLMLPGVPVLAYLSGLADATFVSILALCMFGLLFSTTITAFAHDSETRAFGFADQQTQ